MILNIFIIITVALICLRLHIPAGALIGAMLATAILNITSVTHVEMRLPVWTKVVAQIIIGILVGAQVKQNFLLELKSLILPSIILMVGMITWAVILGLIIHKITGIDILTALFSTSPGGLSDMTIIANESGADSPKVVVMQLVRLLSVIIIYPSIIAVIVKIRG